MPSPDSKLCRAPRARSPRSGTRRGALLARGARAGSAHAVGDHRHARPALARAHRARAQSEPGCFARGLARRGGAGVGQRARSLIPLVGFAIAPGSYGTTPCRTRGASRSSNRSRCSASAASSAAPRSSTPPLRPGSRDRAARPGSRDAAGVLRPLTMPIAPSTSPAICSKSCSGRARPRCRATPRAARGSRTCCRPTPRSPMLEHERVVAERDRRIVEARLRALLHWEAGRPPAGPPSILPVPDRALLDRVACRAGLDLARAEGGGRPRRRRARALDFARRRHLARDHVRVHPTTATGPSPRCATASPRRSICRLASAASPMASTRPPLSSERSTAMRDAARDQIERRLAEASTRLRRRRSTRSTLCAGSSCRRRSARCRAARRLRDQPHRLHDPDRRRAQRRPRSARAAPCARRRERRRRRSRARTLGGPPPADGE